MGGASAEEAQRLVVDGSPLSLDQEMSCKPAKSHGSHWWQTSSLMVGEVMGTGILSLPYAAAGLGWVLSAISLVVFSFFSTYAGVLLSRTRTDFHPTAGSYADLAYLTGGPSFGRFTRCMVISGWILVLPYYLVAVADSLQLIWPASGMCMWQWTLIVAALLVVPLQLTTLTSISHLAGLSSVAMVASVALIIGGFGGQGSSSSSSSSVGSSSSSGGGGSSGFGDGTSAWPPPASPLSLYGHLSAFVFAYQGQSMFLEMQSEMTTPADFPYACIVAYALMTLVYALTTVVAYGLQGADVESFLPDSLEDGPLKRIVGVCLAYHILVSYVVTAQPLSSFAYSKVFGSMRRRDEPLPPSLLPPPVANGTGDGQHPGNGHSANGHSGNGHSGNGNGSGSHALAEHSSSAARALSLGTRVRWLALQLCVLSFAVFVANGVPFFADLQSLIGALSGGPIVFGWPAIFYYRACRSHNVTVSIFDRAVIAISLFVCMPVFTILGTTSALVQIQSDLTAQGSALECSSS